MACVMAPRSKRAQLSPASRAATPTAIPQGPAPTTAISSTPASGIVLIQCRGYPCRGAQCRGTATLPPPPCLLLAAPRPMLRQTHTADPAMRPSTYFPGFALLPLLLAGCGDPP